MDVSQITQLTAAATSSGKSMRTGDQSQAADSDAPAPFADAMTQARQANTSTIATSKPQSPRLESQRQNTATDDSAHAPLVQTDKNTKLAPLVSQRQTPSPELVAMLGDPSNTTTSGADDQASTATDSDTNNAIAALFASLPALQPLTQPVAAQQTGAQVLTASGGTTGNGLLAAIRMAMTDSTPSGDAKSVGSLPPVEPRQVADAKDSTKSVAIAQSQDGHYKASTIMGGAAARPAEFSSRLVDANVMAQIQHQRDNAAQSDLGQAPGRAGDQALGGLGNLVGHTPASQATFSAGITSATPASTAPAGATIPVAVNSPQWPASLGQQVLQMHQRGEQRMELRLHPQELGPLSVTLTVNDQQAQLHILSAHAPVRTAVEAAIPQLRDALAESGIALGEAMVGDQGQFQQGQEERSDSPRLTIPGSDPMLSPLEEEPGEIGLRQAILSSNGNINLYA